MAPPTARKMRSLGLPSQTSLREPTYFAQAGTNPTALVNRKGMLEVCLSVFTDKLKHDAIKNDKPYKVFFKDIFFFKENERAARKKVRLG